MTGPSRVQVVEAGHLGDAATARGGLTSADPSVRASALAALARIDDLTDADLATTAIDESAEVRRKVAELAARYRTVPLRALLNDAAHEVVEMAAWAAGEREQVDEEDFDRLCDLAGSHRDALVREAAVAALGAIGDDRALPTIISALDDKPAIRRRAVIALTPFDGSPVEQAFERARADRDWQVRQLATELSPES